MHATLLGVNRLSAVALRYPIRPDLQEWVLPEGTVPESIPHDRLAEHLKLLLVAWAARCDRPLFVARNLAIRWLEDSPQVGIDPDVCVLDPPPPGVERLGSLKLWEPDHHPPSLCIEVVSRNHPHKDYTAIQDRYAAIGCRELVVCDPLLIGPRTLGGPVPLQLWRNDPIGVFERVHFGAGPIFSEVLDAWFLHEGDRIHIADDREGRQPWMTDEQRERAEKERERAEKERERAARLDVERRLAELEARLGGR
jgi:hypothetical protein